MTAILSALGGIVKGIGKGLGMLKDIEFIIMLVIGLVEMVLKLLTMLKTL